jgi:hypothetical protein
MESPHAGYLHATWVRGGISSRQLSVSTSSLVVLARHMPRQSARKQELHALHELGLLLLTDSLWAPDTDDECSSSDYPFEPSERHRREESLIDLSEAIAAVEAERYLLHRCQVAKSSVFANVLFCNYNLARFRQIARMDRRSFWKLEAIITKNAVFRSNSNHSQHPVWLQLVVTLERLGNHGNGISVGRSARQWGISEGSVEMFSTRVIGAINALAPQYIQWPGAAERHRISQRMGESSGFDGCVGFLDGTDIVLQRRPSIDGETYFNRKKRYALNAQLVCDDKRKITFACIGWPGSVYDATCFKSTPLYRNPEQFFDDGQYLLTDSGYELTEQTLTTYRQPVASIPNNMAFNEYVAQERVRIEHVNGILKARFGSLNGLRTPICDPKDLFAALEWITACFVLYNFTLGLADKWKNELVDDDEPAPSTPPVLDSGSATAREKARRRRTEVQDQILRFHD